MKRFLVTVALGFVTHQANHVIEQWEKPQLAWHRLGRYAVGMVCFLPAFLLGLPQNPRKEQVAEVYLSQSVLFGAGVGAGYVADMLIRRFWKGGIPKSN